MSAAGQPLPKTATIAVVGAGAMGAGIAQVAAVAGHRVLLHDARAGAAESAIDTIRDALAKLAAKGRITAETCAAAAANLRPAGTLAGLHGCALVIEAIVENLDAKRELFRQLEGLVAEDAILATNTSSISVTAIGAALARPERLAGLHFFNPAPLMPLVEIVSGAATAAAVAATLFASAAAWGKTPVQARSTPGFIVNRVARPFYAEALRLLQEGAADPATIDAVMRDCGGFRMGPFELMDLIGHDVNYAVTRSVFEACYGDPRFQPSLIQLELVDAGFLGRKSGRGFFDYRAGASRPEPACEPAQARPAAISLDTGTPLGAALAARLQAAGCAHATHAGEGGSDSPVARADGAALHLTDGRSATERAAANQHADTLVIDLMLDPHQAPRAAVARALQCRAAAWNAVVGLLQAAGYAVSGLADAPGLALMRTVAMLANEACDAVQQQVCKAGAVDIAMRGGVGYPLGPLEWADRIGAANLLRVLDHLARHYGEPRYRASARLRQQVHAQRSLRHD
ncbi:MAG: 3-hydroxyacyl-CoA dehydrogenase [Nevskia sp.]